MIDRINQIIAHLGFTQGMFAKEVGISSGTLSHLQKGRNKPSLEIVMRILEKHPEFSTEWLLFGRGEMCNSKNTKSAPESSEPRVEVREIPKKVSYITIYYDDDTYCNFYPEQKHSEKAEIPSPSSDGKKSPQG